MGSQGQSCYACSKGCSSCTGKASDECTNCKSSYVLTEQGQCYPDLKVYPFPFLLAALLWLVICIISMLALKYDDNEGVEMHFIPSAIMGLAFII
jgi:hypothetical protein